MTRTYYTPPYFDVIAMFLGISNLLDAQKSDTYTVGEGSPPNLKNFFIHHNRGVGE